MFDLESMLHVWFFATSMIKTNHITLCAYASKRRWFINYSIYNLKYIHYYIRELVRGAYTNRQIYGTSLYPKGIVSFFLYLFKTIQNDIYFISSVSSTIFVHSLVGTYVCAKNTNVRCTNQGNSSNSNGVKHLYLFQNAE